MEKRALRAVMRSLLRNISAHEAREAGASLASRIVALEEYRHARAVAVYAASGGEIATQPLWAAARAARKAVLVARLRDDVIEFAAVETWEDLVPGRYGVPVPPETEPAVEVDSDTLLVVPGLAFDARGNRLGRGGGHYDRLLAGRRAFSIGVGFALQLVDRVPIEEHDQPADLVATERGSWRGERLR